jgi:hypothetical protein
MLKTTLLAALLSLAALGAQAQTFGEFLHKPELPLTFMGVDFSATRYYGNPLTVDAGEMKGLFTKIDELLVKEADKYDLQKALHRTGPVDYAINMAESMNAKIDTATIIVPAKTGMRPGFTPEIVGELATHYDYQAGRTGVGLVFVVETIDKRNESEVFWATFVDLATKKMLFTQRISSGGAGVGFRNHWAHPLNAGITAIKQHYGDWKKKYAKS